MKRIAFTLLATVVVSAMYAFSSEPVEVSWTPGKEFDSLLLNKIEIPYTDNADTLQRLSSFPVKLAGNPIKVIIPDIPDRYPPREPKFPGLFAGIFDALTRSETGVSYFYKNRQVRRYFIRCSSKGTPEDPEHANYWLDGKFLGTWDQARPRLMSVPWEDDAVADILFDISNPLTASGVGLYIMPELKGIFGKHRILPNVHRQVRKTDDR